MSPPATFGPPKSSLLSSWKMPRSPFLRLIITLRLAKRIRESFECVSQFGDGLRNSMLKGRPRLNGPREETKRKGGTA